MKNIIRYNPYIHDKDNIDNIYLVQQFYIHSNLKRYNEILFCLKQNCNNDFIDKIYLLNEKIYTQKELRLNDKQIKKVIQVNIKKRLKYSDFFNFINYKKEKDKLKGYVILSNSDIYLNNTITNLYRTNLSFKRACFMQLRLNTVHKYLKIRTDSQDTWIFHSNTLPHMKFNYLFNFNLGIPGCDNKIAYIFFKLNYLIYNEPYRIETIHIHKSNIRNYKKIDKIIGPYANIELNLLKINNKRNNYKNIKTIFDSNNTNNIIIQNDNNIKNYKKKIISI